MKVDPSQGRTPLVAMTVGKGLTVGSQEQKHMHVHICTSLL